MATAGSTPNSDRATRARTLIECIKRLQNFNADVADSAVFQREILAPMEAVAAVPGPSKLTIHLVGADQREGNSAEETIVIFERLFEYLSAVDRRFEALQIVLVGPNIAQKLHLQSHESAFDSSSGTTSQPLVVSLNYYVGSFDDFYDDKERFQHPDLAVCFNAGVWGYDEWWPTLRLLVHTIRTPLLVTSYNKNEADDDEDALEEQVAVSRWFWRAEKNTFGALELRSTKNTIGSELRENDYWMCVRPDAALA